MTTTPRDLPVFLALAGEDAGHHIAVTTLLDRILGERVPWLDGCLDACRSWRPAPDGRPWSSFQRARKQVRARSLIDSLPTGHFGRGEPALPDARMTWAQLRLWKDLHDRGERLDVAVIARDLDHKQDRLAGIRQAVAEYAWPFAVIVAWCQPEVEAWFLAGFEPRSASEQETLRGLRQALGFCPLLRAHALLSTRDDSPKDAKRVWALLTSGEHARQLECLSAELSLLRERGRETGLTALLDAIEATVVPLFTAAPPPIRHTRPD